VLASLSLLLQVVLPVFLLIAVGAAAGRILRLEVASINRLSLYAVVPTLVFRSMSELALAEIPAARLVGAFVLFLASIAGLAWLLGARLPTPSRRALTGTSMLGNAANMNLPVTLFALGQAGLDRALILYVVTAVTMYAVGPVLFGGPLSVGRVVRTVASFPVLWAALIGLAIARTGTTLPLPLERAVDLLADAAIPLMLLILGIQLVRAGRWRPSGRVWTAVGMKLALAPALAFGIGSALGLRGVDLAALTLLAAMPTAVNAVMLSVEFGGDARQVGDTVAVGTLASLVTLPLVLALVTRLV
jgi:predicted permease